MEKSRSSKRMTIRKKLLYILIYPITATIIFYIITLLQGNPFSLSEYWPYIVGATIGGCLGLFLLPVPKSRSDKTQPLKKKVMANIFFFSIIFIIVIMLIVLTT